MRKYSIIFILLIISNSYSQTIKEINNLAEKNFNKNNFKEALELYNKSISIDSTDYNLFVKRAKVNYELKNYQNAQNDFEKALVINPKSANLYNELAFFHYSLNYPENAIEDCKNGLKLIDKNDNIKFFLLNTRADCYRLIGDYSNAYNDYKSILENKNIPEGIEANCFINLAKVLVKLNKNDEAILNLQNCIEKYPKFTVAYINLAFRLVENGNYKKAIAINDKALETIQKSKKEQDGKTIVSKKIVVTDDNSQLPLIYNNRGFAKYKNGDNNEALNDVNYSIQLLPDNSFAYKNRALIYLALGKSELACQDIQKAIELKFAESYGNEIFDLKEKYCK